MRGAGAAAPPPPSASDPIELDATGKFKRFDALPNMPAVLIELQKALRWARTDAQVIARLVASDVGLTAQILRVVNSPFYGIGRQVLDLRFAVAYLGFNEVHKIVLTVSVVSGLGISDKQALENFWFHSYHTALVAKELARMHERHVEPGELWPAALLHDVGELVYMKLYPAHFEALRAYQASKTCLLVEAEEALGLPSHTALGAALCEQWQLPDVIRDVCEHHESARPDQAPGTPLVRAFRRIVTAASLMCDVASQELEPRRKEELLDRARKILGLDRGSAITTMATVLDLREDARAFVQGIL